MKLFKTLVASVAIAAGSITAAPAIAQTELIFNSYLPPFNVMRRVAVNEFAKRIEAESGWSIKVTIPDSSLAPSNQQYEMLLDGVADMAMLPINDMSQVVSAAAIADLPGHAPSAEAASIALWETYDQIFRKNDEFKGVVVLTTEVLNGRQILSMGKPIEKAEDLKGMKFWVPAGPMSEIAESAGSVPVHVPFPQLFEAVSKGVVDGLVASPGSAKSAKVLDQVSHYVTVPGGVGSVSFATAISQDRWDMLTEDQQAAIMRAAKGLPGIIGKAIDAQDKGADLSGVSVSEATPAVAGALKPEMDAQIEAWKEKATAKGVDAEAALTFYRNVLTRVAEGK